MVSERNCEISSSGRLAVSLPAMRKHAGVGPVEQADHMEQSRFTRAGRADERNKFALLDVERDVAQGVDGRLAHLVGLGDVLEDDHLVLRLP